VAWWSLQAAVGAVLHELVRFYMEKNGEPADCEFRPFWTVKFQPLVALVNLLAEIYVICSCVTLESVLLLSIFKIVLEYYRFLFLKFLPFPALAWRF
jgi:hypothetical protein